MIPYGIYCGLTGKPVFKERVKVDYTYSNYQFEHNTPDEPQTPYYIEDEIEAIYNQISVYNRTIDYLESELEYTYNLEKKLKLEKKIADLRYKVSKLENKVNKLLDKWEG
jgi:hypothetical protein